MLETIKRERLAQILTGMFILLTLWWLWLLSSGFTILPYNYAFGATYGLTALFGGIVGISISHKWGFTKSTMGKAIFFLSLGLLSQEFGQLVFSFYNIVLHVPTPYPSLADIGFFSTIFFYIIAFFYLAKSSGVLFTLSKVSGKLQSIIIPIVILAISYTVFLQDYSLSNVTPLQLLLDFGYPLGQSIFVSMALLVYTLSKNFLGGMMKSKVLFLLVALLLQYSADFNFLFQNSRGTWVNGGYGDYLYLLAYFFMSMGILQLLTVYKKIKHEK